MWVKNYCAGVRLFTIGLVGLLIGVQCLQSTMPNSETFSRLNYGLIGRRISNNLCLSHGTWTHVFHIQLPVIKPSELALSHPTLTQCASDVCKRMLVVSNATVHMSAAMKTSIDKMIRKIYDLIPDCEAPLGNRRSSRALDFVGRALHWGFAVATDSQITELKDYIADVKLIAQTAQSDSQRVKNYGNVYQVSEFAYRLFARGRSTGAEIIRCYGTRVIAKYIRTVYGNGFNSLNCRAHHAFHVTP